MTKVAVRTINSEMIIITDKLNHKLSKKSIIMAQAIDAALDTFLIWWAQAVCFLIEVGLSIYNWVIDVYHDGYSWSCYTGCQCRDALLFVLPSLDASGKLYCSPGKQAFYIVFLTCLLLSWFYRKRRQHRDYVMNSYLYGASQAAWAAGIGYSSPHSHGSSNAASPSMNTPDRTSTTELLHSRWVIFKWFPRVSRHEPCDNQSVYLPPYFRTRPTWEELFASSQYPYFIHKHLCIAFRPSPYPRTCTK